eukprot:TRINITY_DN14989_c0_g1_i1.p1 TRINITY_DN14989_c0_g1~~TRINITY_DN14989_c0_g1_i1.p1  ORF type:complete len:562 (-),score=123.83 TRINITY_DN14989_c0_g1_i1:32-1717(-)
MSNPYDTGSQSESGNPYGTSNNNPYNVKKVLAGKPVQLVAINDHKAVLATKELDRIFLDKKVANKKVAIVSVAGSFRKGKSFLLDFFLRYLSADRRPEWLADEEEALRGFSWRAGVERETTGVWLWDQPFIIRSLTAGKEIALFLMDTQGTFDSQSTVRDNVTIFGLSALLSSLQVYNLMGQIQEDDLQHLQLFTEYGMLVASGEDGSDPNAKPFQGLCVLVRDWKNFKDYPLGSEGGLKYLTRILEVKDGQHKDLKSVRQHIHAVFEKLSCFLLPHPGFEVTEDPDFDGKLSVVRPNFKDNLKIFVEQLLSDENIIIKKVNGEEIDCSELHTFFNHYFTMYSSEDLPEPKTMLEVTGLAHNSATKDQALKYFNQKMRDFIEVPVDEDTFNEHAHQIKEEALRIYTAKKKMGGQDIIMKFHDELLDQINQAYRNYEESNKNKSRLTSLRTPLMITLLLLVSYIASYTWIDNILMMLYLDRLIVPLDLSFYFLLIVLITYMISRANSKRVPALAKSQRAIDIAASTVWESGVGGYLSSAFSSLLGTGSRQILTTMATQGTAQ